MSSTTSPCPAFDGLLIVVISSTFGQLIVAAGTIADFGAVILLSIFFSGEGGVGSTLLLIGGLVLLGVVVFFAVKGAERSSLIRNDLIRLQDTPRRSGSGAPWSCWSGSPRSPRASGSRPSSAPSWPARFSPCSTATSG